MLIGILSDSHGQAHRTALAVQQLQALGAQSLIHLGDVETPQVLQELLPLPASIVFGNCDDVPPLARYAANLGITVLHPAGRMIIDGKSIAFTHGHLEQLFQLALDDRVDFLLHGHTHLLRDDRLGPTRILNPGALHRADRYTAILLDPGLDQSTVVQVPASSRR